MLDEALPQSSCAPPLSEIAQQDGAEGLLLDAAKLGVVFSLDGCAAWLHALRGVPIIGPDCSQGKSCYDGSAKMLPSYLRVTYKTSRSPQVSFLHCH